MLDDEQIVKQVSEIDVLLPVTLDKFLTRYPTRKACIT